MALSFGAKGFLIFIVIAFLLAMGSEAKTTVVGGSEGWRFGVNYTDWAIQNSPFYINDKLGKCSYFSKSSYGFSCVQQQQKKKKKLYMYQEKFELRKQVLLCFVT